MPQSVRHAAPSARRPRRQGRSTPPAQFVEAYRFQFFVPQSYNPDAFGHREPVPQRKFEGLHERLLAEFPGLTVSRARPPMGQGLWLDQTANVVGDDCYLYDLIVEPDDRHRELFRHLLTELLGPRETELGLDQQAALLILTRIERLLVERDQETATSGAKGP